MFGRFKYVYIDFGVGVGETCFLLNFSFSIHNNEKSQEHLTHPKIKWNSTSFLSNIFFIGLIIKKIGKVAPLFIIGSEYSCS